MGDFTIPGPIVIVDPNGNEAVTVKDETSKHPNTRSLDVNIRSGIAQVELNGANLRYEKMTPDKALIDESYVIIYEATTSISQKIIESKCVFSNNNVDIKLTVDTDILMEDFNLHELYSDYQLDTSLPGIVQLEFIRTEKQGRILILTFPGGIEFNSSFKLEAKANSEGITMERGIVVRSIT